MLRACRGVEGVEKRVHAIGVGGRAELVPHPVHKYIKCVCIGRQDVCGDGDEGQTTGK